MTVSLTKLALAVLSAIAHGALADRPNIIFILMDDLGYNDIGYHNPEILTPAIDELARTGVILEQYYVQPYCTPSRSSLLTGYFPFHIGRQTSVILGDSPTGLTLEKRLLPEALKDIGYATHMIGKWHLGHCNERYLPNQRGFDSFLGYWCGLEYYYNKTWWGYDFHDGNDLVTNPDAAATFSTYIYQDRISSILKKHAAEETSPIFFYVAIQNPHFPLEVPQKYEDMYDHVEVWSRRIYSGLVTAMDDLVRNITDTLKETGLYNNSIIVVSSDNGAYEGSTGGGSNEPLRGSKGSIWEGGTRVPGFIHSPLLKQSGYVSEKLFHIVDWLPTLLTAAQAPPDIIAEFLDIDGVDQYTTLFENGPQLRDRFVYNLEERQQGNGSYTFGGVRVDDFKLLVQYDFPPDSDLLDDYEPKEKIGIYQLYNLRDDPLEEHDIKQDYPEKLHELLEVYRNYARTIVEADVPSGPGMNVTLDEDGNMISNWCDI